jgi:hypothetical protein
MTTMKIDGKPLSPTDATQLARELLELIVLLCYARIVGELVLALQGTTLGSRSHSSMGRAPPDGLSGPALEVEEECPS